MSDAFDELSHFLDDADHVSHEYPFTELFTPAFMMKYTHSASIRAFLSDLGVTDAATFKALPQAQLDAKVQNETRFADWQAMLQQADDDLFSRRTGLGL
ncbi:hypothetical protein ACFQ5J_06600 [Lacticaseibacillus baoqingensis]|uniref:Uncharacterized protein n=1 Tax=Lacticaseibacillus baoqingensis TaxID=2486013 RepID=A0ABW4E7T3_9LACO|nr:hypothetical protein [Lacticaseibacillus baoqingensis]